MNRLSVLTALFFCLMCGFTASCLAQAQANGKTVSVNGIDLYYEEFGQGEPFVLLHGFSGSGGGWKQNIEALSAKYRLIVPDMRGHGRSTNPSGEFTHRQYAKDVYALLDKLGIKQFKGMGASSGGMTLLHMATQQPERAEAIILVGATIYFGEQARQIMRGRNPDSIPDER